MAYDIRNETDAQNLLANQNSRQAGGAVGPLGYQEYIDGMHEDDNGHSQKIVNADLSKSGLVKNNSAKTKKIDDYYTSDFFKSLFGSYDLRSRQELYTNLYDSTYRFGVMNPYGSISTAREFLFFTKPDLNIYGLDGTGTSQTVNPNRLNDALADIPFWIDMFTYRKRIINLLEESYRGAGGADPFNHLLQNQCSSNLEIQALEAMMIDTPQNMFGVGYSYRGTSESSDDNPSFSLEFKDNRWLDIYTYFKAYEEYEKLKHHGLIAPKIEYAINKIIHDQFSIYKFIVDEDMETILYYGKMYGVSPVSLPRDVFGNPTFDGGLSYNISFKAAFYEDMIPDILADFNALSKNWFEQQPYSIPIYNKDLDNIDSRPAKAAYVFVDKESPRALQSPNGFIYKLCWKGSAT